MTPIPPIQEDPPEICKEYCKDCGAETATWFTDSDIWNLLDTPGILCPNCFVHLIEARGFATTGWKLVPEERIAKLTADNEEADKLIANTVDTLTIWTKQGFATPEGYTPMWNPTLRRLRNYLASRSTRTPPQEGQ